MLWHNFSHIFLRFDYNFFTLLQKTLYSLYSRFIPLLTMLYLGCGNSWHCSIYYSFASISSVDTNNTNIVERSEPLIFISYCTETSFMFGELEVLIPSILLCSLCDSLNTSTCVVRPSNMAASIYLFHGLPRAVERVKKSSWVPLGLKISSSWSILRTLELPKLWFDLFVYLLVCRNS